MMRLATQPLMFLMILQEFNEFTAIKVIRSN
jgi:hypothetical protein